MTTVLEAIQARERAATPGPWEQVDKSVRVSKTYPDLGLYNHAPNAYAGGICNCLGDGMQGKAKPVNVQARDNADFIANSRADIPLLLTVAKAALAWKGARNAYEKYSGTVDAHYAALDLELAEESLVALIAPLMAEEE